MTKKLGVRSFTFYFKSNLLGLLEKYPKLKESTLTLNLLKSYLKTIRELCKENRIKFC